MSAPHEHAAVALELALDDALAGPEVATQARLLVAEIGAAAIDAGCRLIGHVKCLVKSESAGATAGHLYVSLTSLRHGPNAQGELPAAPADLRLSLAAIVYGLDQPRLEALVHHCVAQRFPSARRLPETTRNEQG